jgi:murein L,D-transpeptidase YcbB/YkuD
MVHLQYWTAWVAETGKLNFRYDIYDRDKPLDRALKEQRPEA